MYLLKYFFCINFNPKMLRIAAFKQVCVCVCERERERERERNMN